MRTAFMLLVAAGLAIALGSGALWQEIKDAWARQDEREAARQQAKKETP